MGEEKCPHIVDAHHESPVIEDYNYTELHGHYEYKDLKENYIQIPDEEMYLREPFFKQEKSGIY